MFIYIFCLLISIFIVFFYRICSLKFKLLSIITPKSSSAPVDLVTWFSTVIVWSSYGLRKRWNFPVLWLSQVFHIVSVIYNRYYHNIIDIIIYTWQFWSPKAFRKQNWNFDKTWLKESLILSCTSFRYIGKYTNRPVLSFSVGLSFLGITLVVLKHSGKYQWWHNYDRIRSNYNWSKSIAKYLKGTEGTCVEIATEMKQCFSLEDILSFNALWNFSEIIVI